jgi:hypothetical protein
MSLKSISSFLATILLIGFTISTGIIVYYFVSTLPRVQTQQVSSLSSQVISCSGGFFDMKNLNGIYKKPVTIYPFNFINSIDSIILTINTTANQLSANHSFYLAKVSPIPSYASLTIYYKNLTSSVTNSLFDIFVNGNKLGTLTVPSGITSYTFTNVSVNWLISNGLNNITYQNASINLDSLQIINSTLTYNATLTNDLNDYQVLITIDTASLISQGKLKADCSDIRFLDSDDKTLLNYWIESDCNTANTKIWVKVPFIPASSTKTIYVYYGNSQATSLSNGASTFEFFESFESGTTGWSVVKYWDNDGSSTVSSITTTGYNSPTAGGVRLYEPGGFYASSGGLEKTLSITTGFYLTFDAMWTVTTRRTNYDNFAIIVEATDGTTTRTVAYRFMTGGSPCGDYWNAFSGSCGNRDYFCLSTNTWTTVFTNVKTAI